MAGPSRRQALASSAAAAAIGFSTHSRGQAVSPDLILVNGKFATLDAAVPNPEAVAITGGRFSAVGAAQAIMASRGPATQVIDLKGRRAIPGLIDSHLHIIRGG